MIIIKLDSAHEDIHCTNCNVINANKMSSKILGLEVVFQCRDEGVLRVPVRWTRPGGRPLPPGSKDQQGRLEIPNIRVSCRHAINV